MSLARIVVLVFGVVYVLVGILGFLGDPLVTTPGPLARTADR